MHEGPTNNPEREVSNEDAHAEYITVEVLEDITALENEYRESTAVSPHYAIAQELRRLAEEKQAKTTAPFGDVGAVLYSVYRQLAELYESAGADSTFTIESGLQTIVDTFSVPDVRIMVFQKLLGNHLGEHLR